MALSIEIIRDIASDDLPSDMDLQRWANLAAEHQDDYELCIRIVDINESQELNSTYRGKDKPTNVLSFPFEQMPGIDLKILGDIAICAPIVEREAREQNKATNDHWAHLVIHGVLHLRGFDHITDTDAEIMEQLERDLLKQLQISDPYSQNMRQE